MYHDRKTTFVDAIAQSTDNAYRSQDWWRFVSKANYIRADLTTAPGRALQAADWGSATSYPVTVQERICGEE